MFAFNFSAFFLTLIYFGRLSFPSGKQKNKISFSPTGPWWLSNMACMKDGFIKGMLLDGRYEAISPLNHGSFGMVFLAKDVTTGDSVAIKCLSKSAAANDSAALDFDEHSVERYCHERLGNHQNIVNLIHSFETKAHIYLVLEYCSMGDLYEAIRLGRGPLETKNVRDFMLELVGAVEFMHAKGFYHRDIKPENIFITQDGAMKLGDLGLATSDAWSHEACVGSDRYMAPEQYAPEEMGYAPSQADIWAIGICLLNVLFARNPFVTPTESDVLFADFARDNQSLFDIFPNMSQDTFDVLVHAMAIDPAKRSLAGVRQALELADNFFTDEEVLDDFCTEAPQVAPASANREPLRTPSISSPQIDQSGAFPWAKVLHTSPPRATRQLSTVPDNESYTEDLFPLSEKGRDSWYSAAQNSSMTSGLDSAFGTSFKSMVLNPPVPRNVVRSKPVAVPSSLPARVPTLSSIFGKQDDSVSKSWTDIWDEDEETQVSPDVLDEKDECRRNDLSVGADGAATSPVLSIDRADRRISADSGSDHEVFMFEESAPRYSPPPKRTPESPPPSSQAADSPLLKRNIMDKWAALGNRRRAFNHQEADSNSEIKGKWMNTRDWRAGFGLKVFASNASRVGGFSWDKDNRKELANAKVRNWRRNTQAHLQSKEDLGADVEWVGGH